MEIQSDVTTLDELLKEIHSTESYINGNRKFVIFTPNHNLIREDVNKTFSFPKQHPLEDVNPSRPRTGIMYNNKLYEVYLYLWVHGLELTILDTSIN